MRGLSIRLFWNGIGKAHADPEWPQWFKNTTNVYSIHLELRMSLPCQINTGKWKYVNPCLDFLGIPDQRTAYVKQQARSRWTHVHRSSVTPTWLAKSGLGAWISNCIHVKEWDLIISVLNFNGNLVMTPLKSGHGWATKAAETHEFNNLATPLRKLTSVYERAPVRPNYLFHLCFSRCCWHI